MPGLPNMLLLFHNKFNKLINKYMNTYLMGAQWLSGRVLDSRPKGCGIEPHRRHCIVSLSKNINPSLVLVQPRKTERLLMGHKESNQTKLIKLKKYSTKNLWNHVFGVKSWRFCHIYMILLRMSIHNVSKYVNHKWFTYFHIFGTLFATITQSLQMR